MSLCDNQQFQHGNVHTDFIKENKEALFQQPVITPTIAVAAATAYIQSQQRSQQTQGHSMIEKKIENHREISYF